MKTIIEYQCEICQRKYGSVIQARLCEARGRFIGKNYPVGLMYNYEHNGYLGIFSISPATFEGKRDHYATLVSWACRAPGYPDSLGDQRCSGSNTISDSQNDLERWIKYYHIPTHWVNGPEFTRMVEFLKSQKITPRYYDHNFKLIEL